MVNEKTQIVESDSKKNKLSSVQLLVIIVACVAIFPPGYLQYQLSPIATDVMNQMNLTQGQFDAVFTSTMIPAVCASMLLGIVADKIGIKKVATAGLILTVAGSIWRVFATDFVSLYISMFITGFGSTSLNANSPKLIHMWFPKEKVRLMMGIYTSVSTLGLALAIATTALFPTVKTAFMFAAVLCVVSALSWIFLMPKDIQQTNVEIIPIKESMFAVVKNKTVWLSGISLMLTMCNMTINSQSIPTALAGRNISPEMAGLYGGLPLIGGLVGCLVIPYIDSKLKKTTPMMIVLCGITALCSAFGWRSPEGLPLGFFLFLSGFSNSAVSTILLSLPVLDPAIGSKYAGTAGGLCSALQMSGGAVVATYLVMPFFDDYSHLFIASGLLFVVAAILIILTPKHEPQDL